MNRSIINNLVSSLESVINMICFIILAFLYHLRNFKGGPVLGSQTFRGWTLKVKASSQ